MIGLSYNRTSTIFASLFFVWGVPLALQELKDKIVEYATYIGEHGKTIEMLHSQQVEFEQALSKMQGKVPQLTCCVCLCKRNWEEMECEYFF